MEKFDSGRFHIIINGASTVCQFIVALGISFILTPFIVNTLGVDAYGYIGLSLNIISYTALLSVAVSSMSRRFVSICFHEGRHDEANRYYSSTFYANGAVTTFIITVLGIGSLFIERFIEIPPDLLSDVRTLFVLLFINFSADLLFSVFGYSTFIANRLYLTNLLYTATDLLRAVLLVVLFGLFPARLWYVGVVALVCTTVVILANYRWANRLTPELSVRKSGFSARHLKELVKSGAWNVFSQLADILNQGFELLLANIFVGPVAMGVLAVTKTIPTSLLRFVYALSNNFAPTFTHEYAVNENDRLRRSFLRSMRFLGAVGIIPVAVIFSFSDIFYHCWLPGQDTSLLYMLTCIAMAGITISIPFEGIWYIFSLTNTVKRASVNLFIYASITFATVLACVSIFNDSTTQLLSIVAVRSLVSSVRCLTFAPLYGARVLGFGRHTFYKPMSGYLTATILSVTGGLLIKHFGFSDYTWTSFIVGGVSTAAISIPIIWFAALHPADRAAIKSRFALKRAR